MAPENPPYIIEEGDQSIVSLDGFVPKRKVAFLIQGMSASLSPSFDMMADCLVQRGYTDILAIRDAPHIFCRERRQLRRVNIEGMIRDLAADLSPDDVLFTAILGSSYTKTGMLYLPVHIDTHFSAVELRDLISHIPVGHAVHYVSPDTHAGDFARYLASAQHKDLGNRHIAVAPTVPDVSFSSYSHRIPNGIRQNVEVVTPFHAAFFDLEDQPSLEARFRNAAQYQQKHRNVLAYMRHGLVRPQDIAFRQIS